MSIDFPEIKNVKLLQGSYLYDRQQDMNKYLLGYGADSLLYNFRKAAGLDTLGAEPMKGWDADECKLKGHTTGHFMSGLSLAYAATGDERFRDKLAYIVDGLAKCQAAFDGQDGYAAGFLSAYSEEQFDLLEEGVPYPDIWAPYYTLDKIMSGLLDAYELAGIDKALEILDPLGSWIYNRLSRLTADKRNMMWDTYIAGEYGCMIVTMARLYRHTKKPEHLEAARFFENPVLFEQMKEGRDGLDGMHANQHIPQIMGALELYAETADRSYLEIARNFVDIVTHHHCYAIGGTGEQERFRAADNECSLLTESTCESCASFNLLRLASRLMELEDAMGMNGGKRTALMEYYSDTLLNHLQASFSPAADGATTYFMPLAPGSARHYDGDEENSCCHGTGLESRYRFMRQIFSLDDDLLRVELPVSAELRGEECIKSESTDDGKLIITAVKDMSRRLAVRVPAWAKGKYFTGPENDGASFTEEDGYLVLAEKLKAGSSVTLIWHVQPEISEVPSDAGYVNIRFGPYLLAALSDKKETLKVPVVSKLEADPNEQGGFIADGVRYVPFHLAADRPCHLYFRR